MEDPVPVKNSEKNVISESELKTIAKFVLKEIAINPDSEGPKHPIEQLFTNIQGALQQQYDNNPLTKDVASGEKAAKNLIMHIRRSIKAMIAAHFKNSKEDYTTGANAFNYARDQFLNLSVMWAQKINEADESQRPEIHDLMTKIKTHLDEMGSQLVNLIKVDLKKYKNYINAVKNVRYINELITFLDKDFAELLQLAEKTTGK